jgi:Asp-tRNA(Asn)/Glu-tRNA(Gln) amidotransferase A subunit family amidase
MACLDGDATVLATGLDMGKIPRPDWLDAVTTAQQVVHHFEAARALAWELRQRRSLLSPNLVEFLERGARIDPADYDAARSSAAAARQDLPRLFGAYDVVVTPAAPGEAPEGLAATGDPHYCRAWTLLGLPCLSVPGLHGPTGLPVGVQLIGRPGADALVLATGAWVGHELTARTTTSG